MAHLHNPTAFGVSMSPGLSPGAFPASRMPFYGNTGKRSTKAILMAREGRIVVGGLSSFFGSAHSLCSQIFEPKPFR